MRAAGVWRRTRSCPPARQHPSRSGYLGNNLKTASACRARLRFAEHLARFYWKPLFWHRAYFVSSVGGASLETVIAYVERQGNRRARST
ncbi:transposase [Cupriavidus basilensis]